MEAIRSLFADKLILDDRDPMFSFMIPFLEGEYGLYAPKAGFWNQLALAILIQLLFQELFAVLVYRTIVEARQRRQQQQQEGTMSSSPLNLYLLGYGVYLPCVLYIPFALMQWLEVYNKTLKLAFSTLATIVGFRVVEAMHGTSPPVVESSLSTYMIYYTTTSHFDWNPNTQQRRPITRTELIRALLRVLYFLTAVSIWLSYMMHVKFQPMSQSKVPLDSFHVTWDLLSPSHLINTYCLAVLTYLVLATGFEIAMFGEQIKGFATLEIFDNPLFTSRSIREFWGGKWNGMIHRIIKHGAFLPARQAFLDNNNNNKQNDNINNKHFANIMATAIAFFASGLLHEYCWMVIFFQYDKDSSTNKNNNGSEEDVVVTTYAPTHFKLTLFFLYNALIMTLEHYYGHHFQQFVESWPSFAVSTLLLFVGLPLSHWYTGDWVVGGYFQDFAIGLWKLQKM